MLNLSKKVGKIKYSFLMPYYERSHQLHQTLESFLHFYRDRDDFEVILVADDKCTEKDLERLEELVAMYRNFMSIQLLFHDKKTHNPCLQFNIAAKHAQGTYLVITNPECRHAVDVLGGFDSVFDLHPYVYVVCGCMSLNQDGTFHRWHHHSKYNNKKYHFCSCLSQSQYWDIGGFDERYAAGVSYDDDDFKDKIESLHIPFFLRDDLLVEHQYHDKVRASNHRSLVMVNKKLYEKLSKERKANHA